MTSDLRPVRPQDESPVERDRTAKIERALLRDGRPLGMLGVFAIQKGGRWEAEVLRREDLLDRLDAQARLQGLSENAREWLKECAAWVRGLPPRQCPTLFAWEADVSGKRIYERGTIERAQRSGR